MLGANGHISVFEHQVIRLGEEFTYGNKTIIFDKYKLQSFQQHYGDQGVPYFSLVHNGIRFNEYVGVIQVGDTVVEVLPKADHINFGREEKKQWRDMLISMLLTIGPFDVQTPGNSLLQIKPNSLLSLYFELFINEVEYLLRNGLAKKYHPKEGNVTTLKGSLKFSQHIRENLTHQERFYVRYVSYDTEHKLHCILYKTIRLLKIINTDPALQSRIGTLLLNFPEMPDIQVTDEIFARINYDRKTFSYRNAINIARLLLLCYHPDIRGGHNDVLALMFDMNLLWEEFVYISLRKHCQPGETVKKQVRKNFWKHALGHITSIRPDIVVNIGEDFCVVLDTKWKNINGNNPSTDDLRQMYVYHEYFNAQHVALVYPGDETEPIEGAYMHTSNNGMETTRKCHIFTLSIKNDIQEWQKSIYDEIKNKFNHF